MQNNKNNLNEGNLFWKINSKRVNAKTVKKLNAIKSRFEMLDEVLRCELQNDIIDCCKKLLKLD